MKVPEAGFFIHKMIELRFEAAKTDGRRIKGSFTTATMKESKEKLKRLAEKYSVKIGRVEYKSTFLYKVSRGNEKPQTGEQRAFNRQEVNEALRKLGYKVYWVRKKLLEFQSKPPQQDIISFVKISAELLEQKLSFGEILNLIITDTKNKTLKLTLKQVSNELRQGAESDKTFLKYSSVFGRFTSYMLGLASKSGNMAEIFRSTARFLERRQQFRKDLRSALITPMVTLFILFLAVLFYVAYIFPETAELFVKFGVDLPSMTRATLDMSEFLTDNVLILAAIIFIPFIILWRYFATEKGKLVKDRLMLSIPVIGPLVHKTLIEVFCRVFYTLYSGSADSIEPLRIAAEAADNKYFEKRIKEISIPLMLRKGKGLTEALEAAGIFTSTALSRIHSGEESGTIKNSLKQIADYYESETVYRLKSVIEIIQLVISMIIMIVMIALTLVSAETATISPKSPVM